MDLNGHDVRISDNDTVDLRIVCVSEQCQVDGQPADLCGIDDGDFFDSLTEYVQLHVDNII